ncbi:cytidylyltransferase domain-containing protein [Methylophaga sp.]|uniref:acylneuraminate cytidylyltransferase family protein n=1 Tax=Methylophaga sp. TaxID=2024840 RepID=UPI003A9360C6
MYKGKKILALIPARGGSKGIPGKNIKSLAGKPLISWTIDAAKQSDYIDHLIVSSDDDNIINTAMEYGCDAPFKRPKHLAQDSSASMDVVMHALGQIEETYDYLLLLQPTSPFRTTSHIDRIIEHTIDTETKVVVSVTQSKKHPAFMYTLEENKLCPVLGHQKQKRRQDMPQVYEHNGALYLADISYLKEVKSYNVDGVGAFLIDPLHSIDLDEPLDWDFAEFLIDKGVFH